MKIHPAHCTGYGLFNSVLHQGLLSTPKPAPVTPPAVMPTPDDASVQAAKKAQIAAMATRTGRQSTILTDYGNSDKVG